MHVYVMALSHSTISWNYSSLLYRIKSMEKREIMALWGG